jgi:hypothetical protein
MPGRSVRSVVHIDTERNIEGLVMLALAAVAIAAGVAYVVVDPASTGTGAPGLGAAADRTKAERVRAVALSLGLLAGLYVIYRVLLARRKRYFSAHGIKPEAVARPLFVISGDAGE